MKIKKSIVRAAIALVEDGLGYTETGLCLACGAERDCVEPDAENYPCEACGEEQVFGAEQIVLLGAF